MPNTELVLNMTRILKRLNEGWGVHRIAKAEGVSDRVVNDRLVRLGYKQPGQMTALKKANRMRQIAAAHRRLKAKQTNT